MVLTMHKDKVVDKIKTWGAIAGSIMAGVVLLNWGLPNAYMLLGLATTNQVQALECKVDKNKEESREVLMELRLNMKLLVAKNGMKWETWKGVPK